MSFDNLLLERDGAVAALTINRPHILDSKTIDPLRCAVLGLACAAAVRAVIERRANVTGR